MEYFDIQCLTQTQDDVALKRAAHEFAEKVMRPTAKALDGLSAVDVVADGSPLWPFLKKAYELGYHKVLLPDYYGGLGLNPLQIHYVFEEMAWGSFGLSVLLGVIQFPFFGACLANNEELIETMVKPFCACTDASIRGCWAITEPDHGSDIIAIGEECFTSPKMRGNVQAQPDGDEYILNGQKSAWVSGGTIATHALLFVQIDPNQGFGGGGVCVIPLGVDGVTRGKPLEKLGQRDLNQGEIYFDNVRIPKNWMIAEPDFYIPLLDMVLAAANAAMASFSTGISRAAFEEALVYSKERVQGLKPIMDHYAHKQKVFRLFARTEACRALSRNVINLNLNLSPALTEYSLAAKTQCTEMAYQNCHDLIQLMGGNGLTREYLAEKLFRDARATLIEDGNNETLERHGGHIIADHYPRPPLDF